MKKKIGSEFYYKGKFFKNEIDFEKYVNEWPEIILGEESLGQMLDLLKRDILINLREGAEIKNGEMRDLIEKTFYEAMEMRKGKDARQV